MTFKKKSVPWNKGKKGVMPTPWNKGLKTGEKPWNYVEVPKEELIEFIEQGLNVEKIGKHYNLSKGTISNKLHEYELFEMYKEKAKRWEGNRKDIINNGLYCSNGECGFHCSYKDRLENFYLMRKEGDETLRSTYAPLCKPCNVKYVSEQYYKRRKEEDPDYVSESELFRGDTHKECKTCRDIKEYSEYSERDCNTDGYDSHCKDCTIQKKLDIYRSDMIMTKYKQYKTIMRSEGNDCDLTYEEFEAMWPKNNRCPIRNDIIFQFYPKEDRELWSKGGRHWPFTPTIDHLYPDKPMGKENFWVISWRANETKSDMFVAEIEALFYAIQLRRGKSYIGNDYLKIIDVERKINDIREYVGKYTPKHLESIKKHRKL